MPRALLLAAALASAAIACADPLAPPPTPGLPSLDPTAPPDATVGAALYAAHCASCHGDAAEGRTAAALRPWPLDRDALVTQIAANMPPFAPERCDALCADAIAEWLLTWAPPEPPRTCGDPPLPPPRLRLLSRRELLATARDLFDAAAPPAAACAHHTFALAPPAGANPSAVVVAGSFNGWAATAAAGAWPLARDGATGRWSGTFTVPDGTWEYKFVLDGHTWLTDPDNPASTDDGFGGQNSVLTRDCAASPPVVPDGDALVASFPPEVRPHGFAFDTYAAQVVTPNHVDAWLEAADLLADRFVADLPRRLPCASSGGPACARALVDDLAPRAWRRPLNAPERDRLAALVTAEPRFSDGVRVAVRVILTAPPFLYRSELGEPIPGHPEGALRLTPHEVASALSYTFWGTMPDAPLLDAAATGRLVDPDDIAAHARRLLDDPRARDAIADFAVRWLGADRLANATKHADLFPGFDAPLRAALDAETRAFFAHVVFDSSGRFDELFTARTTFANEAVARHYGLPAVAGAHLREVPLPPERHAGLLAHASVLATTAHSDQTSPILRGLFVRERLLCQTFGAPPPEAGGLPPVDPDATTRERFRQHTDDPACASCHQYIDDVGFGFEHFDPVGRWRDTDAGQPIDAAGDLNDREGFGTLTSAPFHGLPELGALLADSPTARACFVTQLARHAHGELAADPCAHADLQAAFESAGGDIRALLVELVRAPGFTTRRPPAALGAQEAP